MRKLVVTCQCGQRLQVPYSVLGRTGVCTTCGRTFEIQPDNARRDTPQVQHDAPTLREARWQRMQGVSDDVRQLFGKAVDLYGQQRYAEALAILDSFAQRYPGNPDIEQARGQCIAALRRPRLGGPDQPEKRELTIETVKEIVLDKLLCGAPEIQLKAAEIACTLLALQNGHPPKATEDVTPPSPADEAPASPPETTIPPEWNG